MHLESHCKQLLEEALKETTETLCLRNPSFSIRATEALAEKVTAGVLFLSARYHGWWKTINSESDPIDVKSVSSDPLGTVLGKFRLPSRSKDELTLEKGVALGFIPTDFDDRTESDTLNALWNSAVKALNSDRVLQLAIA